MTARSCRYCNDVSHVPGSPSWFAVQDSSRSQSAQSTPFHPVGQLHLHVVSSYSPRPPQVSGCSAKHVLVCVGWSCLCASPMGHPTTSSPIHHQEVRHHFLPFHVRVGCDPRLVASISPRLSSASFVGRSDVDGGSLAAARVRLRRCRFEGTMAKRTVRTTWPAPPRQHKEPNAICDHRTPDEPPRKGRARRRTGTSAVLAR